MFVVTTNLNNTGWDIRITQPKDDDALGQDGSNELGKILDISSW